MAVPYVFSTMPASQGISLALLDDNFAAVNVNAQIAMEELTVSVANTIPNIANTYSGIFFMLIVNGMTFVPVGGSPPFSVTGNSITWLSTVWSVNPGDSVVAIYSYNG